MTTPLSSAAATMASGAVPSRHLAIRNMRLMFLGAPGVGKGTYTQRLAKSLDMPTISSGDLLRAEVAAGTPRGLQLKAAMDRGEFVPDAVVEGMVMDKVRGLDAGGRGYLLDGFPRNVAQAQSIARQGLAIDYVVNLRQPYNVIVAKVASRRLCPGCGFNYNFAHIDEGGIKMEPLKPKVDNTCDHCDFAGEFHTRPDDQEHIVRARLDKYEKETKPLEQHYHGHGKLVDFDVLGGAKQYLPMLMDVLGDLATKPPRRQ